MFDFRIIETADGNQIIDRSVQTPYNALDPVAFLEYTEMANQIYTMDRMRRKARNRHKKSLHSKLIKFWKSLF